MREIVNFILADCARRDVDVFFVKRIPNVPAHWAGTYDGSAIWIREGSGWMFILAHEYCHVMQDTLETSLWQEFQTSDVSPGLMERECELMVLGLIDMFGYCVERYASFAEAHLRDYYGVEL